MPARKEKLPGTLERSPKKVQRTYRKTLDSAHEEYHSEARAHQTAWAAVKQVAKKDGDHWQLKKKRGIEGRTKDELYERARELGVAGRSKMDKRELAEAIRRKS